MNTRDSLTNSFLEELRPYTKGEEHFRQTLCHVAKDVLVIEKNDPDLAKVRVLHRLAEPDRILSFRVIWEDDDGNVRINRGWRVQTSNAIGPYKGGLRFHPSVNVDVLKFLGFEQCFKNALTGLPLGGAKGGADFDPSGCSEREIMRFCQSFMHELAPYIGPNTDVPAGDINVGPREIGYMFGAWRHSVGQYEGAMTGKGLSYGGSEMRVEATGFGLIYFLQAMLEEAKTDLCGKRVAISGKGNVATHAAQKAVSAGAIVVALSDTAGTLHAPDGLSQDLIGWVRDQKSAGNDLCDPPGEAAAFHEGSVPWDFDCDIALPCATQNELDAGMARKLVDGGTTVLAEGANMPLTQDATDVIKQSRIIYAPAKAANAGGVAVSGLEMSQNSYRQHMTAAEVDNALMGLMKDIHARVARESRGEDGMDYDRGANVAGYRRLAQAIHAQGII